MAILFTDAKLYLKAKACIERQAGVVWTPRRSSMGPGFLDRAAATPGRSGGRYYFRLGIPLAPKLNDSYCLALDGGVKADPKVFFPKFNSFFYIYWVFFQLFVFS